MPIKNLLLLKITSFDSKILNLFFYFLLNLLKKYSFQINKTSLKKKTKKITLLKSAHVHKKAREQFQLIKFSFLISFKIPQLKTVEIFSFLKINTPKIVDIRFTLKTGAKDTS